MRRVTLVLAGTLLGAPALAETITIGPGQSITAAARRLVVGVSTGVGRGLLPAVRSRLAVAETPVEPQVRAVAWDDASAGLADGGSDVAVTWAPVPGRAVACGRAAPGPESGPWRRARAPGPGPQPGRPSPAP